MGLNCCSQDKLSFVTCVLKDGQNADSGLSTSWTVLHISQFTRFKEDPYWTTVAQLLRTGPLSLRVLKARPIPRKLNITFRINTCNYYTQSRHGVKLWSKFFVFCFLLDIDNLIFVTSFFGHRLYIQTLQSFSLDCAYYTGFDYI